MTTYPCFTKPCRDCIAHGVTHAEVRDTHCPVCKRYNACGCICINCYFGKRIVR